MPAVPSRTAQGRRSGGRAARAFATGLPAGLPLRDCVQRPGAKVLVQRQNVGGAWTASLSRRLHSHASADRTRQGAPPGGVLCHGCFRVQRKLAWSVPPEWTRAFLA